MGKMGCVGKLKKKGHLVELDHVNVGEREARRLEHLCGGVRWAEEHLLEWVRRHKRPLAQVGLGREAERLGLWEETYKKCTFAFWNAIVDMWQKWGCGIWGETEQMIALVLWGIF